MKLRALEEKRTDLTAKSFNNRKIYRRMKKNKQERNYWDRNGHLLRTSTSQKYVSTSKEWKTSSSITDFRVKDGGYTSRSRNFDDLPEIESLEDAVSVGFLLVKSENL